MTDRTDELHNSLTSDFQKLRESCQKLIAAEWNIDPEEELPDSAYASASTRSSTFNHSLPLPEPAMPESRSDHTLQPVNRIPPISEKSGLTKSQKSHKSLKSLNGQDGYQRNNFHAESPETLEDAGDQIVALDADSRSTSAETEAGESESSHSLSIEPSRSGISIIPKSEKQKRAREHAFVPPRLPRHPTNDHPSIKSIHTNSVDQPKTKTFGSLLARLSAREEEKNFNPTNVFSLAQIKRSYTQHKAKKRDALRYKIPLTKRNIETFLDEQDLHDACNPRENSRELSVSKWILHLPTVRTEALEGALPVGQNSPQKPPYGLYTEKLSGTAFTVPRDLNQQTWLYRILPSSSHQSFEPISPSSPNALDTPSPSYTSKFYTIPNQLRWDPFDINSKVSWIHGLRLVAGAGDPIMKSGLGIYVYSAGSSMPDTTAFYSADGDFLIVPQHGDMDIQTELGHLLVRPNEICVIPRGIRYRVSLPNNEPIRGYVLELYEGHFRLPELGPIGSNGLANARDFLAPVAAFTEDTTSTWHIYSKFGGNLFIATQTHTPFDVVAWHGLYYPYKYDLTLFNTIGSISFDHPDPSIFTVLSAPSHAHGPGTAVADFVIFPPRWLVAEDTFRPPYYHRNTMSEFMGLVHGTYDAKGGGKGGGKGGFQPAGASLHNCMSGHGPDMQTFEKASTVPLAPAKVGEGSMAFMFESCLMLGVTEWGLKTCQKVQEGYNQESWGPLKIHFQQPEGKQVAAYRVTEREEKNGVGDGRDLSSVHDL